jgi:hypothetical protein
MSDDKPMVELFHSTTDADSAAARRHVVTLGLEARIRFRNVFYAEVQNDLTARGGAHTPALWDGTQLREGREKVLAFLDAMAKPR